MTRALNPEGPKGSPAGASVQSNPPSPNADMEALVERVWIDLRQLGKGEDFGEYERWLLRAFIARLKPADLKFLAERDGTMRVVPVQTPDGPFVVRRRDHDSGAIHYEIMDERQKSYRIVCFVDEDEEDRGQAKADADMICRHLNAFAAAPQEEQGNG